MSGLLDGVAAWALTPSASLHDARGDCHAGTRVALCPDGIAEPPECSGCPSYYGSRCGVQWNAPEPEAYTTECDD